MKNIIVALTALGLCASAQAHNRILSTADGVTYTGITAQRVDPDGIYIEYNLEGGGLGMSKIKFDRLSSGQKKLLGMDDTRAHDYQTEVVKANEECSKELIHQAEVAREAREHRDQENLSAYDGRMQEMTRLNALRGTTEFNYAYTPAESPTWGKGLTAAAEFSSGHFTSQTTYIPLVAPDIFPGRNITKTQAR